MQVAEEVADPDCRKVAGVALATLKRVGGEGVVAAVKPLEKEVRPKSWVLVLVLGEIMFWRGFCPW